jgi:kumamolisin
MWKGADMTNTHVVLRGSQRRAKGHAVRVREVEPAARRVSVTVTVRGPELPDTAEPLTRAGLEQRYGAEREDIAKVAAALEKYGLKVENSSALRRSLRVGGSAGRMEDPFDLGLCIYRSAEQGDFRDGPGKLLIPSELEGLVSGVFGLDERSVAHRTAIARAAEHVRVVGDGSKRSLTTSDLDAQYTFLAGRASGQTFAVAEFGGAYFPDDLTVFCAQTDRPKPQVQRVGVGVPVLTLDEIWEMPKTTRIEMLNHSIEVNMDVQIVARLCPEAEIVGYFARFDQKGWVDLLNEVIAGKPTAPVMVSVSWGLAQVVPDGSHAVLRWSHSALRRSTNASTWRPCWQIIVCVAAGDDGPGGIATAQAATSLNVKHTPRRKGTATSVVLAHRHKPLVIPDGGSPPTKRAHYHETQVAAGTRYPVSQ